MLESGWLDKMAEQNNLQAEDKQLIIENLVKCQRTMEIMLIAIRLD